MADLTRKYKNNEKKTYSVMAARVKHTDVATGTNELFTLPPNCLIVDAAIVAEVAGQASLTVDFGFSGGNELGNDIDIAQTGVDTVALVSGAKAPRLLTGTGKTVTAVFSADPTAGEFIFLVEYIEYTKGCGDLTNLA